MSADPVVIVGAARTPQGRLSGALSSLSAAELGATAIRAALAQVGGAQAGDFQAGPSAVERVILGQVLQAGAGQNPARQAALAAGIAWSVPAVTVNKVCLSGLAAIIDAARLIRAGEAQVVVAGGMESMSQAPHLLPNSRRGHAYGAIEMLDHAAHDGLTDATDGISMGLSTEQYNDRFGVTREAQDHWAALSHARAAAAQEAGAFEAELAPVSVPQRRGEPVLVSRDEGVRPETTPESLARLRPAFRQDGTLTAGNSSQISDGAAAVILTTASRAAAEGWDVLAVLGAHAQVAGPDSSLAEQPARALAAACAAAGIAPGDLDHVEINEAFGAVVARSVDVLGLEESRVNPHGGGISLGHPIGASGARLVVHAAHTIAAHPSLLAGVALCGGGGQGDALLLQGKD